MDLSKIKRLITLIALAYTVQSITMEAPHKEFDKQATGDLRGLLATYKNNYRAINSQIPSEDIFIRHLTSHLSRNADPNAVDKNGCSPLEVALIFGYPRAAKIILEAGADPNQKTSRNLRPLHMLIGDIHQLLLPQAIPQRLVLLQLLLQHGADLSLTGRVDGHELDPFVVACKINDSEAIEIMLNHFPPTVSETPLHVAISANTKMLQIIQLIIEKFPESVTARNTFGANPLHYAAATGSPHAMTLIYATTDKDIVDNRGRTALHWAMNTERAPHVVFQLINAHADPNRRDRQGFTPLALALAKGNTNAAQAYRDAIIYVLRRGLKTIGKLPL
jgi:ankyrin repeat protein